MSLKSFHIFFVIVSVLCCLGFGLWALRDFMETGGETNLFLGSASLVCSVVLVFYGIWFLKKLRGWSYL
ncbi:MAG: hypothetical protein CME25_01420 [Gemmatimonadetes bacterium]|nr:hypothetical protein [Gemmatimonadota bacterium]